MSLMNPVGELTGSAVVGWYDARDTHYRSLNNIFL